MYVIPTMVGFTYRVVAMLVASAVLLLSIGFYTTSIAQAANLADISDTLSDSDLSAESDHTVRFVVPTSTLAGVPAGGGAAGTITINFPTFNVPAAMDFEDIDMTVNGAEQGLSAAGASGANNWNATVSSGVGGSVSLETGDTAALTGGEVVVIEIGENATEGAAGVEQIVNPAGAGSVQLQVTAGTGDSGKTEVAIIDDVVVTAIVDTTFTFTITGLDNGTSVNGTTTTGTTTSTLVPFGTTTAGVIGTLAQQLNVQTNAGNGYIVTVEQDGNLRSANGADIDGFRDGTYVDTPEAWGASPINTLLDENTWGHWGITSTDNDLKGGGIDFGEDLWISASTTPRVVMAHDNPSDGTTGSDTAAVGPGNDDVGQTLIGYQIEITALQEAADDYQTTLTYIATPTF